MSFALARVAGRRLQTGQPLPDAYESFKKAGVRIYRGGVTLVGGTPGSCKTMFICDLVDRLKVPTLYISNDSNEATIVSRFLARRTGEDSDSCREKALRDPLWASQTLGDLEWVRWNFSSSPTLEDIEEEILAFDEIYGDSPHLIVVDVLMKVDYADEDSRTTDENILRYMDRLARDHAAALVVAAHTSENVPGTPCQPKSSFINKITKLPILCMTTAYSDGVFQIAPVKNRDGFADSSGRRTISFGIDPAIGIFEEWS